MKCELGIICSDQLPFLLDDMYIVKLFPKLVTEFGLDRVTSETTQYPVNMYE